MFVYLFVVVFICFIWLNCKRPPNFPPGPKWWPFFGNIPLIVYKLSKLRFHHLVWDDLVTIYGPLVGLNLGKEMLVIVAEKELIKEVSLREDFEGRPDGFFWRLRANGERLGVVFVEGLIWNEHRRFSIKHFKKIGLERNNMEMLIINEVISFGKWLRNTNSSLIDMSQVFDVHIINVLWTMVAGKRYERDDKRIIEICAAIHESFRLLDSSGGLLQQFPFLRHFAPNITGYSAIVKNLQLMWNFLNETIQEHKRTFFPGIERDLIDTFLHKMKLSVPTFTDNQLYMLCLDFLQAGSETTGNVLGFFFLYMIKYPIIQKNIQQEIDQVVGKYRNPTLQDCTNMPYTSAVLLETLRITNVAPSAIPHRACQNTHLRGYHIPKDTIMLLLQYKENMCDYWGDPHNFRPERFLDDHGKLIANNGVNAFGYGRRKCIGEKLAKASIFLFCTVLLQQFSIKQDPNISSEIKIEAVNGFSLAPKPYKAIWAPRKIIDHFN